MTQKPTGAPREDGADAPSQEGNVPRGIVHRIRTIGKDIHAKLFGAVEKTPDQLRVEALRLTAKQKLSALWQKADGERGMSDSLEGVDFIEFAYRRYQEFFQRMERQFPYDEVFWADISVYLDGCANYSGMNIFKDSSLLQRMLDIPGKQSELFRVFASALVLHGDRVCSNLMALSRVHMDDPAKATEALGYLCDFMGMKPRASWLEIEEYVERKMKNRSVYR